MKLEQSRNIYSLIQGGLLIQYPDPNNFITSVRSNSFVAINVIPNSIYEIDSFQMNICLSYIISTLSTPAFDRPNACLIMSLSDSLNITENVNFELPFNNTFPDTGTFQIPETDVYLGLSTNQGNVGYNNTKNPLGVSIAMPSLYPKIGSSIIRSIPISSAQFVNNTQSVIQNSVESSNIKFNSFNYKYLIMGLTGMFTPLNTFTSGAGTYSASALISVGFNLNRYSLDII